MQQFLQKYGKALDMSGAFLFVFIGVILAGFEFHLLATAAFLGALAFFASWRAWRSRDREDWVEHRYNRTMCVIMIIAAIVFAVASIIFEVSL